MPQQGLRRPIRAFVFTPIIFLFLFAMISVVIPILLFDDFAFLEFGVETLKIYSVFLLFGLPVAYLGTALLGLPFFFVIRKTKFETVTTCILTTAFIASLIYLSLEIDFFPPKEGSSFSYGDSGGRIIEKNVRTAYGWKKLFLELGQVFLLGAISGLLFWRLYSKKWWGRIS